MRQFTKFIFAIVIIAQSVSCKSEYPKTTIEDIMVNLPAYYFDKTDISDLEIEMEEPIVINYRTELEQLFSSLKMDIPEELETVALKGQTIILVCHATKFKDLEIKSNVSYMERFAHAVPYYKYEITELYDASKQNNTGDADLYYLTGVVIRTIFSTTPIEIIFKAE